jgi:hypothetical protein
VTSRDSLACRATLPRIGSSLTLPADLGAAGMPGCVLLAEPWASAFVLGLGAAWQLVIPRATWLAGVPVYMQALVVDPAAGNQLGATLTNAGVATVGW